MKTPREILLERHQKADEKLDLIRAGVMTSTFPRTPGSAHDGTFLSTLNHPLSALLRLRWLALAPVWIAILAFKFSTHDAARPAAGKSSVAPEIATEVREQRLFLAELIGTAHVREADKSKTFFLRPRSELRFETAAV